MIFRNATKNHLGAKGNLMKQFVLVVLALVCVPHSLQAASFRGLGNLAGGSFRQAMNISADGSTVVGYGNSAPWRCIPSG